MRAVALVPTYQNAQTLPGVLDALEKEGFDAIAVDDGSTDSTRAILEAWAAGSTRRHAVFRDRNGGKAAALLSGFAEAKRLGFDAAVSVDADGQHRARDAARVRDACDGHALIVGCRDETAHDYPRSSLFGRRLWGLGTRALAGIGVSDPVCGMRAYPLHMVDAVHCSHGMYAWEEEFLVRAVWQGFQVRAVAIEAVYLPLDTRVSHYSLPRDWGHSVVLFLSLSVERLLPWQRIAPCTQPLSKRDRSWRRLFGAAVLVGGLAGALLPPWLSVPVGLYYTWRMHGPLPLTLGAIAGGWWLAGATQAWVAVAVSVVAAPLVTLALRPLDRS